MAGPNPWRQPTPPSWCVERRCQTRSSWSDATVLDDYVLTTTATDDLIRFWSRVVNRYPEIWISNFGQISEYGNTHTIIKSRVQTVRVCAACLDTVERVFSWYSETARQRPLQQRQRSPPPQSVRHPAAGRDLQRHLLILFSVPCRCGLVLTVVKGHVPCVASTFRLFPSSSPLVLSLPHIKRCGCG